mmetsp:Transcript_54403/g.158825  ORF Transcript_54403/g.158825 Transcript_54403/m.158825 type:complete len:246 (-) Transcript_54403:123-860(-)
MASTPRTALGRALVKAACPPACKAMRPQHLEVMLSAKQAGLSVLPPWRAHSPHVQTCPLIFKARRSSILAVDWCSGRRVQPIAQLVMTYLVRPSPWSAQWHRTPSLLEASWICRETWQPLHRLAWAVLAPSTSPMSWEWTTTATGRSSARAARPPPAPATPTPPAAARSSPAARTAPSQGSCPRSLLQAVAHPALGRASPPLVQATTWEPSAGPIVHLPTIGFGVPSSARLSATARPMCRSRGTP